MSRGVVLAHHGLGALQDEAGGAGLEGAGPGLGEAGAAIRDRRRLSYMQIPYTGATAARLWLGEGITLFCVGSRFSTGVVSINASGSDEAGWQQRPLADR